MPVLSARNLSKSFGAQTLFSEVSLTVTRGERVGLLGVNGTGKSTLLRVLADIEPCDSGVIERRRDASILYLPQEPVLDPDKTPRQIVESGLVLWHEATARYADVTRRMESEGASDALLAEQAELADRIERLGGWERGHVVEDVLGKLGVLELDRAVGSMSGGERRRVALAHLLVAKPTLAILDEPTNHLDADTIAWLEEHLANEYPGAVLVVTHDRYVLDAIADRILELDRGKLYEYQGGFGDYLDQKAERLAHDERTEQNRLNLLRREKAWLMRGAQARSTKQKARIQRAEALIAAEPSRGPGRVELDALEISAPRTGKTVLDLLDIDVVVAGRKLVSGLTLHLLSGERIGILGPNGIGKTSLLRIVTGELEPARGEVVRGTQTRIALFDQARAALRDDWSILDNVAGRQDAARLGAGVVKIGDRTFEMRSYLEHFLFDGHKQRQSVGSLSGGERARVALAKVLRDGANLLLLDEPTNDLDVDTLAAVEELLETWPGSVLLVSHDRWFLDRVATSILVFEANGRVVRYPGNYSTYRSLKAQAERSEGEKKLEPRADREPERVVRATTPAKKSLTYAERIEVDGIMEVIARAEERVTLLEAELSDPALWATRAAEAGRLRADLELARGEVARLIARWEALEARR